MANFGIERKKVINQWVSVFPRFAQKEAHWKRLDFEKLVKPPIKKTRLIGSALKPAMNAAIATMGPGLYIVAGKPVVCSHSGG
jgi:hypothetical protein